MPLAFLLYMLPYIVLFLVCFFLWPVTLTIGALVCLLDRSAGCLWGEIVIMSLVSAFLWMVLAQLQAPAQHLEVASLSAIGNMFSFYVSANRTTAGWFGINLP